MPGREGLSEAGQGGIPAALTRSVCVDVCVCVYVWDFDKAVRMSSELTKVAGEIPRQRS